MNNVSALVGLKNPDGSILLSICEKNGTPDLMLPMLNTNYSADHYIRALLKTGKFESVQDRPSRITYQQIENGMSVATPFHFKNFDALLIAIREELRLYARFVFIWVDGEWTCAGIADAKLYPQDTTKLQANNNDGDVYYPYDKWIETYFPGEAKSRPQLRTVKPMSKEDWLKANYPNMSELPKWRFPASA
jgi:hypothetical protein